MLIAPMWAQWGMMSLVRTHGGHVIAEHPGAVGLKECRGLWGRAGCSAPCPFHQTTAMGEGDGEVNKLF